MGKRGKIDVQPVGRHFGRVDLERVGFFDDPPLGPFDKYQKSAELRDVGTKGRQILCGQPGGLFEKKFTRILEGEALTEPWRDEAKARTEARKKMVGGRELLPPAPAKMHSTPDDWFGCFGKQPPYFSPQLKDVQKRVAKAEAPNCKIKPNPLGGPGYVDICFSSYPKHDNEPYGTNVERDKKEREGRFLVASAPLDHFPPNPYVDHTPPTGPIYVPPIESKAKTIGTGCIYVPFPKHPGGHHAGCFSKFPEYSSNPYETREKRVTPNKWLGAAPTFRSKYTNSIIDQATRISCNANNYPEYRERVYPLRDY